MKVLVVSDSHMYNDILEDITKRWKNKVDLLVHCGDSSLLPDDDLLKDFDIVVHGNHDEEVFPHYVVYKDIFVTHGNDYHVYSGYDELIEACKENNCHICFHGHTHVPTIQVHEDITREFDSCLHFFTNQIAQNVDYINAFEFFCCQICEI